MMAKVSPFNVNALLAVEVGSVNTRASLIDSVEGKYRFVAGGKALSTMAAPMLDTGEGVRDSIDQLAHLSGRLFIGEDESLIIPSVSMSVGIDQFVATISPGKPIRAVVVGLLEDVSVRSIERLLLSMNTSILDKISLSDPRRTEAQIDSILRIRPDLIAIAGGTDKGASRSMLRLLNTVGFAIEELPINFKPEILYAGNKKMSGNVQNILGELTSVSIVDNIRPNLETENFGPAELRLLELFRKIYGKNLLGVKELEHWANGNLIPSSIGFGRVVKFLSQVYDPNKGVLGINIGATSTIAASSFAGKLNLRNFHQLGIGSGLTGLLARTKVEDIQRWIPYDVTEDEIISYIYNKSIYPVSLPATGKDLAIEQALAREVLRTTISRMKQNFPQDLAGPARGGLPWFEPIMIGGSVITDAPGMNQALLMILDGIQPTGISRIILDKNSLAPALGAVAGLNAILAVQTLESNAFFNLGSVISPIGRAKVGSRVVRVTIQYASGQENRMDVKFGEIKTIPLPNGQSAEIHLQPLNRFDVGMGGPGKSGRLKVVGGYFGVIIDARGRPLILPKRKEQRRESLIRWQKSLKG